jgi:hypothetical protein
VVLDVLDGVALLLPLLLGLLRGVFDPDAVVVVAAAAALALNFWSRWVIALGVTSVFLWSLELVMLFFYSHGKRRDGGEMEKRVNVLVI